AVKQFSDENDTMGKIVMSCMTPVADGIRISIDDPEVKNFRASVIEWLMLNHPHDCPVCDEGGECHLQDMTVMTGHVYRRSRFKKRTHRNQYLGQFVNHEMNRCIQCYRCIRFYCGYAGGRDFNVFGAHDHVYFGRHQNGVLENEFSGNLVEICPTGVFTDKTLKKHFTRKWDLQTAPSVCVHCGLGCNTIAGERYGKLRRILNRYNGEVNGYFLCDRGRFGYEFVNSGERIRTPLIKDSVKGTLEPVSGEKAIEHLSNILFFGAKVIGIGSPRASLEANFLLKTMVGEERFFCGTSEQEHQYVSDAMEISRKGPTRMASLKEAASADAVFILGEDLVNVAPMLGLAVRQSVKQKPMEMVRRLGIPQWDDSSVRDVIQHEGGPLFIATPCSTKLDDIATGTYCAPPEELARLGFAVAHAIDMDAPEVSELDGKQTLLVEDIAAKLRSAKRPLIISGMSCGSHILLHAAANVAWALCRKGLDANISITMSECNSLGLGLISGRKISEAFDMVMNGKADTVIILENDLYWREENARVDRFLQKCAHVIVIDHIFNKTVEKAEVVLPAGTFAESDGTLVNSEGRSQRFFKVFLPEGEIRESWRWLRDAMVSSRRPVRWQTFDEVVAALATEIPALKPVTEITPPAGFRVSGQKIPRQPRRYSGRTAILANLNVREPMPPNDPDSALSFSMEGYEGSPPSSLVSRYWVPGWNSVQALNKFQSEVGGTLIGDDTGRRLVEPGCSKEVQYFSDVPERFTEGNALLIVPLYHIFGSEELSSLSPSIAERAPRPYLALNPEDAARSQVEEEKELELVISGNVYRLPVIFRDSLPRGIAGLPSGLRGLEKAALPAWGKIRTTL
ncbi:MAG TPA: NADH-quinone oxidoreductase subunit NuoG, partial [Thermodesulfovibrionales bacterium]|nr:NADH-quinone oxidoreductase subunit NuoG [Thermodesulfovibrionales bacterium]